MSGSVQDFYDRDPSVEWKQLGTLYSRIEFQSTLRLINKYFPKSGSIVDIGGGPGRYAIELSRREYKVALVDLSLANIALAERNLAAHGLKPESVFAADARNLSTLPSHFLTARSLWSLSTTSSLWQTVTPRSKRSNESCILAASP
ncbi:MAG: class I SAM-dependent methyltransferase [Dehalococcoidia bacterium]|nr:class I SAM-dependent methyltransferase [Dehalococcoidia bacterium]